MTWSNLVIWLFKAKTFVIDEADMTLDMGFLETVDKIAGSLPKDLAIHGLFSDDSSKIATILEEILVKSCHGEN